MSPEKNNQIIPAPAKIKPVAVKRRIVEPKSEPEKTKAEEVLPKKSKLAVRIVGREPRPKAKEEMAAAKEEKISAKASDPVKVAEAKEKKSAKTGKDYFHRSAHHIEEKKDESSRQPVKEKNKAKQEASSRPVGVYRKISLFFIILTLALLAAAFYFFVVSMTIEVTPKSERISDKLNISITNGTPDQSGVNLSGEAVIGGSVEQIPVKDQKTYEATGANILGQEITGRVSLINNYSQEKTLVATTRLLSPGGLLYRIKNQVTIPAGGSVSADIYTDDPAQDMAIGPTSFTIPGLWAGLQDKIYAKSTTTFVYQSDVQKFVQDSDIAKAAQDIKESLIKEVNDQFTGNYKGYDKVVVNVDKDTLVSSSTVKANAKVASFNVSLSAMVDVVAFQTADVKKLAQDRLISALPAGEKLVNLDENEMQYNLSASDFKSGTAELEVPVDGTMSLTDADTAVDKTKLVGLSASQINLYLQGLNKFSDIKLIFMPPFIDRAPSLVDRIKIVIK